MYGYKIKINSLPEIVWACETSVENYKWKNHNEKNMLELAFSKYKSRTVIMNNCRYDFKGGDFSCIGGDIEIESYSNDENPVTISSVAMRFNEFECTACDITSDNCGDTSYILVPAFYFDLSVSDEIDFIKSVHSMIKYHADSSELSRIAFFREFYGLLMKIDTLTRSIVFPNKSNNYYIKKANYIIERKYAEKISLSSVAGELNITPVYLSTIYKQLTGINFSDQILNVRMKNAENMLLNQNIPTSKIALKCGFCDESYFRKKFKIFFGMNVREYRKLKNGITLYHDKPIPENN